MAAMPPPGSWGGRSARHGPWGGGPQHRGADPHHTGPEPVSGERPHPERGTGHRAPPDPPPPPPPPGTPSGPWGAGPAFAPGHFFGTLPGAGTGRRQGARARRGDVRTGILFLLAEGPHSGYEIIRAGRERSGGAWRPSPGSVYPMLQQLQEEGLVRAAPVQGRRRPFELTGQGAAYLDEHGADLIPPWETMSEACADTPADHTQISALAYQLSAAAVQVVRAGSPEQVERAKLLMNETKRGLYRILADDDRDGDRSAAEEQGEGGPRRRF